jgi:hypothetical protein
VLATNTRHPGFVAENALGWGEDLLAPASSSSICRSKTTTTATQPPKL